MVVMADSRERIAVIRPRGPGDGVCLLCRRCGASVTRLEGADALWHEALEQFRVDHDGPSACCCEDGLRGRTRGSPIARDER